MRFEAGEGEVERGETPLFYAPQPEPVQSPKQDEGGDADFWIPSMTPDGRVSPLPTRNLFADLRRSTTATPKPAPPHGKCPPSSPQNLQNTSPPIRHPPSHRNHLSSQQDSVYRLEDQATSRPTAVNPAERAQRRSLFFLHHGNYACGATALDGTTSTPSQVTSRPIDPSCKKNPAV
jgi:hypothetical protein